MHQDYHFLKRIAAELHRSLLGLELIEAFFDHGDNVAYLGFASPQTERWMGFVQQKAVQALIFPKSVSQYGKRVKPLFRKLNGKKVKNVYSIMAMPCLVVSLQDDWDLLFKLESSHAALALYQRGSLVDVCYGLARADQVPNHLPSEKRVPQTIFQEEGVDFIRRWLGKTVMHKEKGRLENPSWQTIQKLGEQLEKSPYLYICHTGEAIKLRLWEEGEVLEKMRDPLQTATLFWQHYKEMAAWAGQKQRLQKQLKKSLKKMKTSRMKNAVRLKALSEIRLKEKADILMANLHQIPRGASEATLFDFYKNEDITLSLSPRLSPQKYAEKLYKKAKGQHIEERHLKNAIRQMEDKIQQHEKLISELEKVDSTESWQSFKERNNRI